MREDVAVSQPAVRDRQKEGVSKTRSEASKRRGSGVQQPRFTQTGTGEGRAR